MGLRQIGRNDLAANAVSRLQLLRQVAQTIFATGHQHALHSPSGQLPGKLGSDPRGSPGDKTPATGIGFQHDARLGGGLGEQS